MSWNDGLAGATLTVAATNASPLRVMAGPGTGKSFAMKRRVARLLEESADPKRILAITFTRNAAASLLKDLNALGIEGCDRIRAGTLHSFCFWLLRQQHVFEYLNRIARPLITFPTAGVLQYEGGVLLDDLISDGPFGHKRDCTKRIRAFEAAWAPTLSFNWRLILAPEFVLRYLVTHEAAHLAVPDHSAKFWLTVQSLCPETEKAKQRLCARTHDLGVDLELACGK